MKNFSILALTLSATVAITPAFAETTPYYNTVTPSTQQADLSFAFDSTENLQATAMTDKEMAETEGAWVANVVGAGFGGVTSHFGYMGNAVASGQYNAGHHLAAIGTGAGMGFISPVRAAGKAITISAGTKTVVTTTNAVGGPAVGVGLGNKFDTLNIK